MYLIQKNNEYTEIYARQAFLEKGTKRGTKNIIFRSFCVCIYIKKKEIITLQKEKKVTK